MTGPSIMKILVCLVVCRCNVPEFTVFRFDPVTSYSDTTTLKRRQAHPMDAAIPPTSQSLALSFPQQCLSTRLPPTPPFPALCASPPNPPLTARPTASPFLRTPRATRRSFLFRGGMRPPTTLCPLECMLRRTAVGCFFCSVPSD